MHWWLRRSWKSSGRKSLGFMSGSTGCHDWLTPQERKALWEEYPEVQEMYEEYNGILPEDDGAWERVAERCHQIREQYQTMQVEVALLDVVWQLECLAKRKRGD